MVAASAPSSRAASVAGPSPPAGVSGSPTTTPTGACAVTNSRNRGIGKRLPRRRVSVARGEAMVCDSSESARPKRISPQSTARTRPAAGIPTALLVHRGEEFLVGLGPLHPVEQELQRFDRRHVGEEVPEEVDLGELALLHEELLLPGAGPLDVDGGIDPADQHPEGGA